MLAIFAIFLIGGAIYFAYGKNVMRSGVLKNYAQRPASSLFGNKQQTKKQIQQSVKKASSKLDPKLASSAGAIVPLLGNETSPEMLIEMAAAIQSKKVIQALILQRFLAKQILTSFWKTHPQKTL